MACLPALAPIPNDRSKKFFSHGAIVAQPGKYDAMRIPRMATLDLCLSAPAFGDGPGGLHAGIDLLYR